MFDGMNVLAEMMEWMSELMLWLIEWMSEWVYKAETFLSKKIYS